MRFSAIPEITEISVFGKGLGTGQFKAHHIGEDIIHPAQIFGQFKTTLVTAEVADAAVVIVIAEYKIVIFSAFDNVDNPVIFVFF